MQASIIIDLSKIFLPIFAYYTPIFITDNLITKNCTKNGFRLRLCKRFISRYLLILDFKMIWQRVIRCFFIFKIVYHAYLLQPAFYRIMIC
jgi:hypothetical protein